MREAEVKTESKDAFESFFETEHVYENAALQNFVNKTAFSKRENEIFAPGRRAYPDFLRQALLFFPGTFILFYVSLATGGVITELLKNSDRQFIFEPQLIFVYLFAFLSILFTWLGLGDLKDKKHFVIPGSIILSGALVGIAVSLTENIFWLSKKIIVDFGYAIYLFPVALIVPFLAKGWVDRKTDKIDI